MPKKEMRELDKSIKEAEDFMALWLKFHELYKQSIKDKVIVPEAEKNFLETQTVIARRYRSLTAKTCAPPYFEDKPYDAIKGILSIERVSNLSDMQLSKIERKWRSSYTSLNRLLEGLKAEREKLSKPGRVSLLLNKLKGG